MLCWTKNNFLATRMIKLVTFCVEALAFKQALPTWDSVSNVKSWSYRTFVTSIKQILTLLFMVASALLAILCKRIPGHNYDDNNVLMTMTLDTLDVSFKKKFHHTCLSEIWAQYQLQHRFTSVLCKVSSSWSWQHSKEWSYNVPNLPKCMWMHQCLVRNFGIWCLEALNSLQSSCLEKLDAQYREC